MQQEPCNNVLTVTFGTQTFSPTCNPVDCELGPWTTASECTSLCGGGQDMIFRSVTRQPSGGGIPCPTDPSEYVTVTTCNTQSCAACEYETWAAFFQREPSAAWSSCTGINGVQSIGPRRIVKQAPPGGFCDPKDAYLRRTCCPDGNCEYCLVGCNGEVCSGRGTCVLTNTTQSDGKTVVTTGACECQDNFEGANCGTECPLGPNGLVCSGKDRGTCVNGACSCTEGVSGPSCAIGGSCLIRVFNGAGGVGGGVVCADLRESFTSDQCEALPQISAAATVFGDFPKGGILGTELSAASCAANGFSGQCTQTAQGCFGSSKPMSQTFGQAVQRLFPKATEQARQLFGSSSNIPSKIYDKGDVCGAVAQADVWYSQGDGGWFTSRDFC